MSNVFDYLKWRGDLKLWEAPFCDVDALILTELTYIDHDGIVPADFDKLTTIADEARIYGELHQGKKHTLGAIVPAEIIDLFLQAAVTKRYCALGVCGYCNIIDDSAAVQFAAVTTKLSDGSIFVGFRGTDDSIAGWKENFQMSFKSPVPAQHLAAEYLERAADYFGASPIRVGGHSKGGNLALWAAANCRSDIAARIVNVYNMDGPGFLASYHQSTGYQTIKNRIKTIVPERSLVGMLLDHEEHYTTVKSSAQGLHQHDALTWGVEGTGFCVIDDIPEDVKRGNKLLSDWLARMDDEFRERFTDAFFSILYSTHSTTLTDLASDKTALLRAFSLADAETRGALYEGFKMLLGEGGRSITEWLGIG